MECPRSSHLDPSLRILSLVGYHHLAMGRSCYRQTLKLALYWDCFQSPKKIFFSEKNLGKCKTCGLFLIKIIIAWALNFYSKPSSVHQNFGELREAMFSKTCQQRSCCLYEYWPFGQHEADCECLLPNKRFQNNMVAVALPKMQEEAKIAIWTYDSHSSYQRNVNTDAKKPNKTQ